MEDNQSPVLQLQLQPEQRGFQLNENVLCGGVAGKIIKIGRGRLYVKFINHIIVTFHLDGRYWSWQTESVLTPCGEAELGRQALAFHTSKKKNFNQSIEDREYGEKNEE